MRRIIFHAGFHKTGTTSLQQTLRGNRKALRPGVRLVLRGGMKPLCEAARIYSQRRRIIDLGFVKYEAALLAETLQQEDADTILISSEDLSGHMPGHNGLLDYGAAPYLMRAISVAFAAVSRDDELVFLFTTCAPDSWLRSCYAHHLHSSKMVLDQEDYIKRFRAGADFDVILDVIKKAVPNYAVKHAILEEHRSRRLGIAGAAIDLMMPTKAMRASLVAGPVEAPPPSADLNAALLALNRSNRDKPALRAAKRALIADHA